MVAVYVVSLIHFAIITILFHFISTLASYHRNSDMVNEIAVSFYFPKPNLPLGLSETFTYWQMSYNVLVSIILILHNWKIYISALYHIQRRCHKDVRVLEVRFTFVRVVHLIALRRPVWVLGFPGVMYRWHTALRRSCTCFASLYELGHLKRRKCFNL